MKLISKFPHKKGGKFLGANLSALSSDKINRSTPELGQNEISQIWLGVKSLLKLRDESFCSFR